MRQCLFVLLKYSTDWRFKVPDNAKLQKETVLCLVKGSTVFINYLGWLALLLHGLSNAHSNVDSCDVCFLLSTMSFFVYRNNVSSAHDVAQARQHKCISASDVIKALELMQFNNVSVQCQNELNGQSIQKNRFLIIHP